MSEAIPFGRPMIGKEELAAVTSVLEGPILVHGPVATQFEKDFGHFTGANFAISVSSCTAGMHLFYFVLGIGEGDEVIVPAETHIATAHAVELCGARAVFVDAERETGNIDIGAIEAAITPRTKAIAVVHYLGVPVDMGRVTAIADKHDLRVIEDCALSIGASFGGVHTGLHGDAGVFSFYPVKHMTTAEGGMIILKDEQLYRQLKVAKAFGVDRSHGERRVPGMYDAHSLGFNYRMSEVHAAIGVEQLKKLPRFLQARRANFEALSSKLRGLEGIRILPQPKDEQMQSSHYCLGMLLGERLTEHRPTIMNGLKEMGVGTSVYYPHPVPRMSWYREKYGYDQESYRTAAAISDSIVALPVGPHLGTGEMQKIAECVEKIIAGVS